MVEMYLWGGSLRAKPPQVTGLAPPPSPFLSSALAPPPGAPPCGQQAGGEAQEWSRSGLSQWLAVGGGTEEAVAGRGGRTGVQLELPASQQKSHSMTCAGGG